MRIGPIINRWARQAIRVAECDFPKSRGGIRYRTSDYCGSDCPDGCENEPDHDKLRAYLNAVSEGLRRRF
jgi:hypothetical protein